MEIRTSDGKWFHAVCMAYKNKIPFTLVDDAGKGITPELQSALEMGVQAGLNKKEILACFLSIGLGVGGTAMVAAAILDPEPTSSLALLVGGGIGFIAAGGFSVMRMLTKNTPTNISIGRNGFNLSWGDPPARHTDIHNYPGVSQPPAYGRDDLREYPDDRRRL